MLIGIIIGLFIGVLIGVGIMCLMSSASDADDIREKFLG